MVEIYMNERFVSFIPANTEDISTNYQEGLSPPESWTERKDEGHK